MYGIRDVGDHKLRALDRYFVLSSLWLVGQEHDMYFREHDI